MKNNFSTFLVTALVAFIQAGVAWLGARWLDAFWANITLSDFSATLAEALFAGIVFAFCALPGFNAPRRNPIAFVTLGLVAFLIPLVILQPDVPARALVLFYTLTLVIDVVVSHVLSSRQRIHFSQSPRLAEYLNSTPHAIFLIAGLSLVALVPFALALDQSLIAERFARWAFGFLMLGTAVAVLTQIEIPARLKSFLQSIPYLTLGLLIFVLLTVAYLLDATNRISPNVIFYTDTQPNLLESRVKDGDVIVSASPSLHLGDIRNVGVHLDLDPNANGTALWEDLTHALAGKRRVFWVSVPGESSNAQSILAEFLRTNGCLDESVNQKLSLQVYELRAPFTRPGNIIPLLVDWQNIRLIGINLSPRVCSHDALVVSSRWQLTQPSNAPLKASWFIIDNKGRRIQTQDSFLIDLTQHQTNQWRVGDPVVSEFLLPIPFGTPPGEYSLGVAIYPANNPQRLRIVNSANAVKAFPDYAILGAVQVYRPDDLTGDPYQTIPEMALLPARVELRDGLQLDAYSIDRTDVMPGEEISIIVRWQVLRDELPKYQVRVQLVRDNQTIAETTHAPVDDIFTTDQWRAREFVLDRFELRVPPDTSGGTTRLEIDIVGGRMIYLADIEVAQVEHNFNPPTQICPARATFAGVGELVGCELPAGSVASQNRLTTTLHWRANAKPTIDRNYVVFVQLIASDGHLIAQSDATPARGQRPTRGWVDGEIVRDDHALEWIDPNYRGAAKLIVGIYDATTFERVLVQGTGESAINLADIQIIAP